MVAVASVAAAVGCGVGVAVGANVGKGAGVWGVLSSTASRACLARLAARKVGRGKVVSGCRRSSTSCCFFLQSGMVVKGVRVVGGA